MVVKRWSGRPSDPSGFAFLSSMRSLHRGDGGGAVSSLFFDFGKNRSRSLPAYYRGPGRTGFVKKFSQVGTPDVEPPTGVV